MTKKKPQIYSSVHFLLECSNEEFLVSTYQLLLGRAPDKIGVTHYAHRLQTGIPRSVIIAEIWSNQLKLGKPIKPLAGIDQLMARYETLRVLPLGKMRWRLMPRLGARITDASGFDWVRWAANYTGSTHSSVKKSLSNRDSFTMPAEVSRFQDAVLPLADFLALPDEAFIEQAFRALLRREVDGIGMVQYLSALLDGQDRLHILQDLYQSEEATRVRTLSDLDEMADDSYLDAVYQRLLGRTLDPEGRQSYQPLIAAGKRKEIVADIKASSEYQQQNAHRVKFEGELEETLRQCSLEKPALEFSDAPRGSYLHWLEQHEKLSEQDRKSLAHRSKGWVEAPLITVIIRASERDSSYLDSAIRSVRHQVYSQWQLVVAVASTPDAKIEAVLGVHTEADARIRVERLSDSGNGLSEVCSSVLEQMKDGYLLFLDPVDQLAETALFWIADTLRNHPECRLLYSDEDTISADGLRSDPYFKPVYNYELHLAQDLMGRTCVFETELLRDIGGFRPGFAEAEHWDASLRAVENLKIQQIAHIPRVLLHRRSDRILPDKEIRMRVVQEHLQRKGLEGTVVPAPDAPHYNRVIYARPSVQPSITIIIPTRDRADLLQRCTDSIRQKSTYQNYEILIVDNGSTDPDTLSLLQQLAQQGLRVERLDIPFNYSTLNNVAAEKTQGEYLCFLNNDTEILTPDWLEEMVSFASQDRVGVVGARLWYPDGRVQHAGVITGRHGNSDHIHKNLTRGETGYFGRAVLHQTLSAVTGACMLMRRHVFEQASGFDEAYPVSLGDIDFCLRVQDLGYANVWTPYAELIHHESASRGLDAAIHQSPRVAMEVATFQARWGGRLFQDPAYNPNLSLDGPDFSLAYPPRQGRIGRLSPHAVELLVKEKFPFLKEVMPLAAKALIQKNARLRRTAADNKRLAAQRQTDLVRMSQDKVELAQENEEIIHNFLALQEEMELLILERKRSEVCLDKFQQLNSQLETEKDALLQELNAKQQELITLRKERDEHLALVVQRQSNEKVMAQSITNGTLSQIKLDTIHPIQPKNLGKKKRGYYSSKKTNRV